MLIGVLQSRGRGQKVKAKTKDWCIKILLSLYLYTVFQKSEDTLIFKWLIEKRTDFSNFSVQNPEETSHQMKIYVSTSPVKCTFWKADDFYQTSCVRQS